MRSNYVQYNSPQFRILSDKQLRELHFATLEVLERTGVAFESDEAIKILGDAGADISDSNRVRIPSHLVEKALREVPKMVTLYSREGEPAIVLNGLTGSHFGASPDGPDVLDPYSNKRRKCYVKDIIDIVRLIDALPNIEWFYTSSAHDTVPSSIAGKVTFLQCLLNSSKPIIVEISDLDSLREMISLCHIVSGGEQRFRQKPFFASSSEPISPLLQGRVPMEKSLLCAEKGIPNVIYGMPMAGATAPATFPGCMVIANAEVLSQLVVLQTKYPGAPIIFGSIPSIMDMKTTIYTYGAPEMSIMVGGLTELCHYYGLPMFGTGGCTDAEKIDAQTGAEITYQIILSMLTGADLVHDVGEMYHSKIVSAELIFLVDEIVEMMKVMMNGIVINSETLPINLIERLGPKSNYLAESHTVKHFRKFWMPRIFDRSMAKKENTGDCAELLNKKTIDILKTHIPKPLPEDITKELKKHESIWLDSVNLKEYPSP